MEKKVNGKRWCSVSSLSIRTEIYFKENLKSHNRRGWLMGEFRALRKTNGEFFFFLSWSMEGAFQILQITPCRQLSTAVRLELVLMSNLIQENRPALSRCTAAYTVGCLFCFFPPLFIPLFFFFPFSPLSFSIFGHNSSFHVSLCSFFLHRICIIKI